DRFREAWDSYVRVNRAFADAVLDACDGDEVVLVQDYQLSLVPGMVAAEQPSARVGYFHHTPFADPPAAPVLPTDVIGQMVESLGRVPCGSQAPRWRDAYHQTVRELADTNAAAFVAPLGPDSAALAEVAASDTARQARRELDEMVGDRQVILRT